jgi:hypothetical protein
VTLELPPSSLCHRDTKNKVQGVEDGLSNLSTPSEGKVSSETMAPAQDNGQSPREALESVLSSGCFARREGLSGERQLRQDSTVRSEVTRRSSNSTQSRTASRKPTSSNWTTQRCSRLLSGRKVSPGLRQAKPGQSLRDDQRHPEDQEDPGSVRGAVQEVAGQPAGIAALVRTNVRSGSR